MQIRDKLSAKRSYLIEIGQISRTHSASFQKGMEPWNKGLTGWVEGKNNPFYGKTHSDETKEKISKANKGRAPANRKFTFEQAEEIRRFNLSSNNLFKRHYHTL